MHIITFLIFGSMCFVLAVSEPITAVYQCCPEGQQLINSDNECGRRVSSWELLIVTNNFTKVLNPDEVNQVIKRWHFTVGKPKCNQREKSKTIFGWTKDYLLLENGSFWYQGDFLRSGSFCVDGGAVILCERTDDRLANGDASDEDAVHVQKCCFKSEALTPETTCGNYGETVQDETPEDFFKGTTLSVNVSSITFRYGFPECDDGIIQTGRLSVNKTALEQDGSLHLPTVDVRLRPKTFCLEHHLADKNVPPAIFTCPEYIPKPDNKPSRIHAEAGDIRLFIYPAGFFISVFFLAVTLIIGRLIQTTHHMLHWRCQTCHIACLMLADFFLAFVQLASDHFDKVLCYIIGILIHFFYLTAFFWLNTMCFNIWWTFRDLRPSSLDKRQEMWRLRMYELYAWGIPLFIVVTGVTIDNLPETVVSNMWKPRFAQKSCWFYGEMEVLLYFFGPVGVLLFLNLFLFIMTARELTCGLWKSEVVKSTTERATLWRVCLKLVVVMGITWIIDFLSWAVPSPLEYWYLADIINILHGFFIFLVVGCQPQVWAAVKRYACCKTKGADSTSTNGHQQSSSQDVPSLGDSISNNTHTTCIKTPLGEALC